jgi:hypothetical protein
MEQMGGDHVPKLFHLASATERGYGPATVNVLLSSQNIFRLVDLQDSCTETSWYEQGGKARDRLSLYHSFTHSCELTLLVDQHCTRD